METGELSVEERGVRSLTGAEEVNEFEEQVVLERIEICSQSCPLLNSYVSKMPEPYKC